MHGRTTDTIMYNLSYPYDNGRRPTMTGTVKGTTANPQKIVKPKPAYFI